MKKTFLALTLGFIIINMSFGQVYTNKEVGKKNTALADSIKAKPYPYVLPIWGAKAAAKGYNLPYSAGVSVNYLQQESSLIIDNLYVGFNNGPMYNLDEIVRFDDATSRAGALTIRPDVWVLPFLNVYAILGKAKTSTEINAGVWLPDTANIWREFTSFTTKANFDAVTAGLGMTPTIGIGGGWLALDMNCAWTDVSALEKPVFTYVFGPRAGKTFKMKKPDQNIAFWAGGSRVKFSAETKGLVNLSELTNTEELQKKVDQGFENVNEKSAQVDSWWEGLSSAEQKNPINIAKYETANRTLTTASNILTELDGALNDEKSASVQYSLQKNLKDKWNFIIGSQLQVNKHLMYRVEYGFLASRTQFMGGVQSRFGL
jgi:RNAse (barnase) inhibitor barstar